jgi:hypothetical protein
VQMWLRSMGGAFFFPGGNGTPGAVETHHREESPKFLTYTLPRPHRTNSAASTHLNHSHKGATEIWETSPAAEGDGGIVRGVLSNAARGEAEGGSRRRGREAQRAAAILGRRARTPLVRGLPRCARGVMPLATLAFATPPAADTSLSSIAAPSRAPQFAARREGAARALRERADGGSEAATRSERRTEHIELD